MHRALTLAAILYTSHAANLSGAPVALMLLCRETAGRGHETFFVAPDHGPLEALFPDVPLWPARGRGLRKRALARNLLDLLKQRRFDLAHVNCIYGAYGALAAKKAGLPVLWHVHEDPGKAGVLLRKKVRELADVLVVPSRELQAKTAGACGVSQEKIHVVPNGVNVERINAGRAAAGPVKQGLGFAPDCVLAGTVGTLCPRKGTETFIRAAARAAERRPDVRFLVAGDEQDPWKGYLAKMRRLARSLGLADRIAFVPATPLALDLMAAMDVFVLASLWEGMPMVLLEAMALGKPVAATAVGGVPELVQDGSTGFLARPRSAGELAAAMEALLEAPALRREMGARARADVEANFSLKIHVDRMERIHASLC